MSVYVHESVCFEPNRVAYSICFRDVVVPLLKHVHNKQLTAKFFALRPVCRTKLPFLVPSHESFEMERERSSFKLHKIMWGEAG